MICNNFDPVMNLVEKNQYDNDNVINPLLNEKILELKNLMKPGKAKPVIHQKDRNIEGATISSRITTEREVDANGKTPRSRN